MGGNPFIGMLLAAGFNFAPQNTGLWALCAGQLISIASTKPSTRCWEPLSAATA